MYGYNYCYPLIDKHVSDRVLIILGLDILVWLIPICNTLLHFLVRNVN